MNRLPSRDQPQRDAGQKAHPLDGVNDLLGDADTGRGHTADAVHHGLYHAPAHGENARHNVHRGADGQFCQQKADKVPQYKFRALEVPEGDGGLEHAHGEEQHQQAVTHGFQRLIDGHDGRPDGPAVERLGRGGDKAPYLGNFAVPGFKGRLQVADDPVIAQSIVTSPNASQFETHFSTMRK